jgi:N-acetylglucosamine-6-phosphate deacetylase
MARTLIHSAQLVSHGIVATDSWVLFEGSVITGRGTGSTWRDIVAGDVELIDATGRYVTPGFVDIHCHGGGGAAFEQGQAAIDAALAMHRKHGTTRSILSLVTASVPDLEASLAGLAQAAEPDPLIIGAHLEGPFLDREYRGAHDHTLLLAPDAAIVDRLLAAGNGLLRQVTLAPELPGATDAIARFTAAGVAVAVGHSSADYETAVRAFDAGARLLTHAFNGMKGIHHRAPGPVVAAMHHPGVTLELINDGVHVHPQVVRLAFEGAPGRVALVTDAMAAAGADDGDYRLGRLRVSVTRGVARLSEGGAIAGSTLTLDESLRRAVQDVGVDIATAVSAVTEIPAGAIGRGTDLGRLQVGYAADAVILGSDLVVDQVFAGGRRVS